MLPDNLFSNKRKTKEGDTGDGILDVFDLYNFTVNEDEPLEKEVAVDPEMLGKVFENLLEVQDRKSKGTYYTPREIVHYMCQQSLINYLFSALAEQAPASQPVSAPVSPAAPVIPVDPVNPKDPAIPTNPALPVDLVISADPVIPADPVISADPVIPAKAGIQKSLPSRKQESEIQKSDLENLIKQGDSSIEHDTIHQEKQSETYKGRYKKSKLPAAIIKHASLIDKALANIKVCDPAVGSGAFPVGMMNEIIRARTALTPFIKAPITSNNSLIPAKPVVPLRAGIHTPDKGGSRTPYHFKRHAIEHCLYGVDIDPSAIEIAKLRLWLSLVVDEEDRNKVQPLPNLDYKMVCGNSLLGVKKDLFNLKQFNKLEKLKPLYFNETNPRKKKNLKDQIDQLINQITNNHKAFDFEVYFSEVFHEKKGFDVVIANPPYDVIKDKKYRQIYNEVIYGRANLYGLFITKSVRDIVRPFGHITFINPKTLLADKYFCNLRKFLKNNGCFKLVLKIIDRHKIFEQVLQSVIVYIFQKKECPSKKKTIVLIQETQKKTDIKNTENRLFIETSQIWLGNKFDSCILISNKKEIYTIFNKICNNINTKSFSEAGIEFKTGKIQWNLFKKNLTEKPSKGSIRLIWAENIQRYQFRDSEKRKGKEFIKGPIDIQPNIRSKTIITQRTTADEQKYRIISTIFDPEIEGFKAFSENHTNYLSFNKKSLQIEYILGLLNSNLFDLIFRHINSNTQVSSGELNSLPIKDISFSTRSEISNYVDKILNLKKEEDYLQSPTKQIKVQEYEKQIDQLVYKLYNLTPKEIKIIEENTK